MASTEPSTAKATATVPAPAEQSFAVKKPPRRRFGWLVLFASVPTLVCCALPIAFVTLGFGASWAALYSAVPLIGFVAGNKIWFFVISALILALAAYVQFRPGRSCPTDPELAALCASADRWNKRLIFAALAVWLIGFASAYLSLPLMELLG